MLPASRLQFQWRHHTQDVHRACIGIDVEYMDEGGRETALESGMVSCRGRDRPCTYLQQGSTVDRALSSSQTCLCPAGACKFLVPGGPPGQAAHCRPVVHICQPFFARSEWHWAVELNVTLQLAGQPYPWVWQRDRECVRNLFLEDLACLECGSCERVHKGKACLHYKVHMCTPQASCGSR